MIIDKASIQLSMSWEFDGDIRLRKGRTQKFLAVGIHSPPKKQVRRYQPSNSSTPGGM
jgi:hypothetical protein